MILSLRLAELGIVLPAVAAPVAAYVPAKVHGDLVYTSGQLPMDSGVILATGRVGDGEGSVPPAVAGQLARQCALNALSAAGAAVGSIDRLGGVLKVTGFVASDPEVVGQPVVVNGASELLTEIFGDDGAHARSAVGVAALPMNAPVEVEVIFSLRY